MNNQHLKKTAKSKAVKDDMLLDNNIYITNWREEIYITNSWWEEILLDTLDRQVNLAAKISKRFGEVAQRHRLDHLQARAKALQRRRTAHVMIPEFGLKFVPFIVPKKLRDGVAGDLTEDFRTYAARWGRSYALRWLWWELAILCIRRFGPTAIVTGIGAWLRHEFGW